MIIFDVFLITCSSRLSASTTPSEYVSVHMPRSAVVSPSSLVLPFRLRSPLIWSLCCLLRPGADVGPDTFAPARKTFMMKFEAGKREVRTNRETVFFKPLFYFATQCPESTVGPSL